MIIPSGLRTKAEFSGIFAWIWYDIGMTPQEMNLQLIDTVLVLGVLPLVIITSCVYLVLSKTKKKKARLAAKLVCGLTTALLLLVIYFGFIVQPGGI
jgi:uncharacterized membrane protein